MTLFSNRLYQESHRQAESLRDQVEQLKYERDALRKKNLDTLNWARSILSEEQTPKMDKTKNPEKVRLLTSLIHKIG